MNNQSGTEWDNTLERELFLDYKCPDYSVTRPNKNTIRFHRRTPVESKNLFKSKTFWTNVAIVAGTAGANYAGTQVDAETGVAVLGVANIILRLFTKKPTHILPVNPNPYDGNTFRG